MKQITISTKQNREVVDVTERVEKELDVERGRIDLFLLHTTAGLTTADLDPGTDKDMLEAFWEMIPDIDFRHPHDPSHAPAHLLASLIGPSLSVFVENGEIQLGTWQRIVLVEFDGPRERNVLVSTNVKTT